MAFLDDFLTPQNQFLLTLATGLMRPTQTGSFGEAIGTAAPLALKSYSDAQSNIGAKELRELQLLQLKDKIATATRKSEALKGLTRDLSAKGEVVTSDVLAKYLGELPDLVDDYTKSKRLEDKQEEEKAERVRLSELGDVLGQFTNDPLALTLLNTGDPKLIPKGLGVISASKLEAGKDRRAAATRAEKRQDELEEQRKIESAIKFMQEQLTGTQQLPAVSDDDSSLDPRIKQSQQFADLAVGLAQQNPTAAALNTAIQALSNRSKVSGNVEAERVANETQNIAVQNLARELSDPNRTESDSSVLAKYTGSVPNTVDDYLRAKLEESKAARKQASEKVTEDRLTQLGKELSGLTTDPFAKALFGIPDKQIIGSGVVTARGAKKQELEQSKVEKQRQQIISALQPMREEMDYILDNEIQYMDLTGRPVRDPAEDPRVQELQDFASSAIDVALKNPTESSLGAAQRAVAAYKEIQGKVRAEPAVAQTALGVKLAQEQRDLASQLAKEQRGLGTQLSKEQRNLASQLAKEQRDLKTQIAREQRAVKTQITKEQRSQKVLKAEEVPIPISVDYALNELEDVYEESFDEFESKVKPEDLERIDVGDNLDRMEQKGTLEVQGLAKKGVDPILGYKHFLNRMVFLGRSTKNPSDILSSVPASPRHILELQKLKDTNNPNYQKALEVFYRKYGYAPLY